MVSLALLAAALLLPCPVDAQVHFGLPSAVKSAVKKLKSKKNSATVSSIVLGPKTKVLSDDTNSKFLSVSPDSVTYHYNISAAQFAGLSPGDILLSSQSDGLLKKIVSISATPTEYIVQTATATLEEAFEKLDVSFTRTFTPSQVSPRYLKDFSPQSVSLGQFKVSQNVALSPNITAGVTLKFTPSIDGRILIESFQLKEFSFTSMFDGQLALTLTAGAAETLAKEITVAEFPMGAIMAGPVPIVANYAVTVGVDANLKAGVVTSVTQNVMSEAGVSYVNGAWTPYNTLSNSFTVAPPTFSAEGSVKAYITPAINAKIFDVAGPYVNAQGYLKGIVTTPLNHLPWEVKGGITVNGGAEVAVLGQALTKFAVELYNAEIQLSTGVLFNQEPMVSGVTADPEMLAGGESSTLTCAASDADDDTLTYNWSAEAGTVSGTGSPVTWTAPTALGTYIITCGVTDGWGGSDQQSAYIVVSTANHMPVITSLTANPASVSTGAVTTITCAASDADAGDDLDYTWSADSGAISGSGGQITWTAPASSGTYVISCEVSDGKGSARESVNVNITTARVLTGHELADTGQEQSYTDTFGEDHDYQPAAFQPSYTANGGTTTDNRTGLTWGPSSSNSMTWATASTFCGAGRLPSVSELESIVDAGASNPAINTAYFPDTRTDSMYWTSTPRHLVPYVGAPSAAWHVFFYDGSVYNCDTNSAYKAYVRCVTASGASPAPSYTDNGDGTTSDNNTGLMWVKDCGSGVMSWEQALSSCEGLTYAGYSDWRLPNRRELLSIVDYGADSPAINTTYFPIHFTDAQDTYYWTSTSQDADQAWTVFFTQGASTASSKTEDKHVRCVRGGL